MNLQHGDCSGQRFLERIFFKAEPEFCYQLIDIEEW